MKKTIPLFFILAVVVIFFRQFFLQNLLPIPSDTLIGLYNPFRDLYAQQYPRGIPFKNFLITDPIRQQYPWRELTISLEKNLQVPLWNPYSFSGYPLLANFQSAAFYPLNILFFFLPFSFSWSLLIFFQPLLAGIFLYLYLRNLKLHPLSALLGALAFAFSGFSVAWLEWGTIMQTLLWLPLLLLCIDKLSSLSESKNFQFSIFNFQSIFKNKFLIWLLVLLVALCCSFFAGHIQTFFYIFLVLFVYVCLQFFQASQKKILIFIFLSVYVCFALITAIQWIPTLQFILQSTRSIDQNYLTTTGWFIPYQHVLQFFAPDFFGNPTTLNYWGVWNYGELVGYIGIVPLVFALFAIISRHDKKTYFFGALALIGLVFALPTPLAQIPYALHIPFLSTSQPTRLLGIVDFSLTILGALGLDYFIKNKKNTWQLLPSLFVVGIVFVGMWVFVLKPDLSGVLVTNILITKHNLFFPTMILVSSLIILLLFVLSRKFVPQKIQMVLIGILLLLTIIDLLRFADKFDPFTPTAYLYPQTATISFLQKNIGNYRFMTTDSQILPPNVSDMYHLQSIEGYDPLYLANYGAFIAAISRKKPDISTPFGFNRIITPHDIQDSFINLLGIKYILSFVDLDDPAYKKVFQEGQTKIYENTQVSPRAFFVSNVISVKTQQDAITAVFANENNLSHVAIIESSSAFLTTSGLANISTYSANNIVIQTNNTKQGFLVLTDIYYPTWHAYIDGQETKIYPTDFTFRGVIVPKGKHIVEFKDQLF